MSKEDLNTLRQEFLEVRQRLAEAQKYQAAEPVENYVFQSPTGPVDLASLFGNHNDLFVIHNMGVSCPYCTLWADGLNGVLNHLQSKAPVVISSPDSVEVQSKFKADRDWDFTMVTTADNTFAEDMGYRNEQGSHPGVSVFTKTDNTINRVADTPFGPGDDFCAVWHLFGFLPNGADGWQPKHQY